MNFRIEHDLLKCPDCGGAIGQDLSCSACRRTFAALEEGVYDLTPSKQSLTKEKIAVFWGDTCQQWYSNDDLKRDSQSLDIELRDLEDLLNQREHLTVKEVDLTNLKGKRILEIGSGGGGHSALFRKYGARVVAVDYTPERVLSTASKLRLLDGVAGTGSAFRADAEFLPFADDSFDIVYSNGVLHHTENTENSIREMYRVLKPGGHAVVMLYSRHSAHYWCHLFPRAFVTGMMFKMPESEWVGCLTEGTPTLSDQRNPITRVYSEREIKTLLAGFEDIRLRKNSFLFEQLPIPRAPWLRERLLRLFGKQVHQGGRIIYGRGVVPDTALELALGKSIGWGWNVTATKAVH